MASALREEFGDTVTWPDARGGFFLWATLPAPIDSDALIPRAVENGVIYVAGEAFFVGGGGDNIIRLSFSAPPPARIKEGVARLAKAVRAELEAIGRSSSRLKSAPAS
jgi:2-aminoadipate transaminase